MSFLSDTLLPSSTRLHIARGGKAHADGPPQQSRTGLFAPLVQLVRDPVSAIVGSASHAPEEAVDPTAEHRQILYLRMRNAENYAEWKAAATELDTLEGNDTWKREDESDEFDAALVAARVEELDSARLSCDVKRMLFLVRTTLTRGLGGMGDLRLYKHSHIGTKDLIERYIDSAQQTLTALLEVSSRQGDQCPIEPRSLMEQLLATRQSFGRSALLLSGGGTFGMNHIGVVKCLWQARLLPRIISGASAGSIVCAVLCSKTDPEIPDVLHEFCYGDMAVFEKEGEEEGIMKKAARFLKYGSLFDISHLTRVMKHLLGDMTFQESYNRTRRILNITVSSASLYELPRLLNYVTAPNVMIWSAVCASCSVPFVFSAASLLAKDPKTGKEVPWNPNPNAGWIDGSVDNDLPMTRLAEMFNVNHFIVSQVNPHVVPFLVKEEENLSADVQKNPTFAAGPTWMNSFANLAKGEALHRLQVLSELGVFPNYVTKARSVLNQRYSGDITIFPSISYANFPRILANPTTEFMLGCLLTGERATWPKLSRIQNHVAIELALDEIIQRFRARVVFSPSQVDLRLNNFNRPLSQGNEHAISSHPRKATRFDHDTAPSTPLLHVPSRSASRHQHTKVPTPTNKPYLPTHPSRKFSKSLDMTQFKSTTVDVLSSSTNLDETSSDEGFSGDINTDTSDVLSSPSPLNSPSPQLPTLWPSTRQVLVPSNSQRSTETVPKTVYDRRNSALLNLAMTPAAPSSPELQYKRLSHGSTTEASLNPPTVPSMPRTDSLPEEQLDDFVSSMQSPSAPSSMREESRANSSVKLARRRQSQSNNANSKEVGDQSRSSRRGSTQGTGLGLMLDISGTRGMMLRKKNSRSGLAD